MCKLIGLTGPTGSGKSTVAAIFKKSGAAVIDSDLIARQVVEPGSETLLQLCHAFGNEILMPDRSLNRKKLASLAFSSAELTRKLNQITHPAIIKKMQEKIEIEKKRGVNLILLDIPLLFQSGLEKLCDLIIVVIAEKRILLDRIVARDKISLSLAEARLASQNFDSYYLQKADYIILNSHSQEKLEKEVEGVYRKITEGAQPR